jgi:hypothetical protein
MMKGTRWYLLLLALVVVSGVTNGAAGPPDWSVNPAAYQYTGSVTSAVYRDLVDVGSDGDMLGAFVGEECRGVIEAWRTPGSNYVFLITLYSDLASGDSMAFRYYDAGADVVCSIDERVEFVADMIVGSLLTPMQMHIDGCQPFVPANPIPCNGCWQDTVVAIAWDGGDPDPGDSVVYYVFLGTETDPPLFDSTEVYPGSTTAIIFSVPPLNNGVIYHWRVMAKDRKSVTASGLTWSFSMGPGAIEPTPWGRIKMLFE